MRLRERVRKWIKRKNVQHESGRKRERFHSLEMEQERRSSVVSKLDCFYICECQRGARESGIGFTFPQEQEKKGSHRL